MVSLKTIIITFILILVCLQAQATTYYVCDDGTDCNAGAGSGWSTGNDSNDGLAKSTAWKTVDEAQANVSAGDTVIVGDGTYTNWDGDDYLWRVTSTGTSGNWITFKAENKWGAILDGQLSTSFGVTFGSSAAYIRIEDFEIKNCYQAGVINLFNPGADNIYVYRCWIHHHGRSGFGLYHGSDNWTLDSNVIHDIWVGDQFRHHGVYAKDTLNLKIINNIIYDCPNGWPIHLFMGTGTNTEIINNTLAGKNPNVPGQIILAQHLNNILIQNNIFYDSKDYAIHNKYNYATTLRDGAINNNLTYGSDLINIYGDAGAPAQPAHAPTSRQ